MSPLIAARAAAAARGYGWGLSAGGPAGAFESIATVTAAGGETSLSFTNIPQNYVALQIRGIQRSTTSAGSLLRFNSDSGSNYAWHRLDANGTSPSAAGVANDTSMNLGVVSDATYSGAAIIDIYDYASTTKYKTARCFSGKDANGSGFVRISSSVWMSTSAVTSLTIFDVTFSAGTSFALYGIRGA